MCITPLPARHLPALRVRFEGLAPPAHPAPNPPSAAAVQLPAPQAPVRWLQPGLQPSPPPRYSASSRIQMADQPVVPDDRHATPTAPQIVRAATATARQARCLLDACSSPLLSLPRLPVNAQVLRGNVERVELAHQCQVNQQGGQQADSRRDANGETAHRRGARCDLPVQGTAHVREQGAD